MKWRSSTSLLWDELLSPKVPQALRVLGIDAIHVGQDAVGIPPRGSTDQELIEYAKKMKRIIVTSNHDMMLLCKEAGQRFVWIDPRGRQYDRIEQTLLVFRQINTWDTILEANADSCVRALRTKCEAIDPAEAVRLVDQRMKVLSRRRRKKAPKPLGSFVSDEPM